MRAARAAVMEPEESGWRRASIRSTWPERPKADWTVAMSAMARWSSAPMRSGEGSRRNRT